MKVMTIARKFGQVVRGHGDFARDGVSAVALACMAFAGTAAAQFASTDAPDAQTWTNLLGSSTDGSESGIYEFNALISTAIPIMLLITILWAGLAITRRVIRSFRGS